MVPWLQLVVEEDMEPASSYIGEAERSRAKDADGLHTGPQIKYQAELICRAAVGVGEVEAQDAISEVLVPGNPDPSPVQKRAMPTQSVESLAANGIMGNPNDDIAVVGQGDDRGKVRHGRSEVACAVDRVDDPMPTLVDISLLAGFLT